MKKNKFSRPLWENYNHPYEICTGKTTKTTKITAEVLKNIIIRDKSLVFSVNYIAINMEFVNNS